MEVRNLAIAAFILALERNQINPELLLKGTGLTLDFVKQSNKFHRWDQFVLMYENCVDLLGEEKTIQEIAYQGIFNKHISKVQKMGSLAQFTGIISM